LQSDDLANAVASAQANQRTAQLKLDDLLDGSTAAELAAAEQAVAAAQSTLTREQNDYDDLLDGSSASEVASAQQAVELAESQVATATNALEKLENTPSDADLAAAEAGVASAESALTAAENSAENAENTVVSALASLDGAQTNYCAADGSPDFCASIPEAVSSADLTILTTALGGVNATLASAAIAANTTYINAVNTAASADAAVAAAQNALDSAEAKLELVEEGPTAEEMDAAESSLASAEAALDSAEAKLADVNDGADQLELSSALSSVEAARAGLSSAQARLDEARRGPDQNTLEQARQAVRAAQLSVEATQIRLRDAQIIAPFDGTVASLNIAPGEFASGAGSGTPAIVMLTPDALILKIDVGETDYANLKLDMSGVALFDGISGGIYPFRITEIGLAPTSTQGVVTYEVTAALTIPPGGVRPVPGMNARGQLTTSSKPDILVVPPRAIRRRGSEQIVDLRRNGVIEEQVVTTGLSDNTNVEVVTGLSEGDIVVMPAINATGGGAAPTPIPTIPGGIR
jgi:HlyD family secretion protein